MVSPKATEGVKHAPPSAGARGARSGPEVGGARGGAMGEPPAGTAQSGAQQGRSQASERPLSLHPEPPERNQAPRGQPPPLLPENKGTGLGASDPGAPEPGRGGQARSQRTRKPCPLGTPTPSSPQAMDSQPAASGRERGRARAPGPAGPPRRQPGELGKGPRGSGPRPRLALLVCSVVCKR